MDINKAINRIMAKHEAKFSALFQAEDEEEYDEESSKEKKSWSTQIIINWMFFAVMNCLINTKFWLSHPRNHDVVLFKVDASPRSVYIFHGLYSIFYIIPNYTNIYVLYL